MRFRGLDYSKISEEPFSSPHPLPPQAGRTDRKSTGKQGIRDAQAALKLPGGTASHGDVADREG